MLSAQ